MSSIAGLRSDRASFTAFEADGGAVHVSGKLGFGNFGVQPTSN